MEHFGRYELRRRLGVGGMAEVYEAVAIAEHGIEKPLVIKRILEEHSSDEQFQEMFRDEARVAMRLNHPNVVQVFDFGRDDDNRYFLAMELVRGKDLGAIISRAKQEDRVIPAGVAVYIAGEAAKGLDHAHRLSGSDGKPLGIVHRDVSPQNILISTDGGVKVGDFGIAKFNARAGKTQVQMVRGKVRYMSPEQAEGSLLDGRSDLFSLALVLYEMITGKYAFDGRADLDVLDQVRKCEPKKPSEITNVPAGLEAVILRALSREAKFRYSRGNEFQRELESFAVEKGLRATSGALAEYLNSLFPEIESRNSAADGVTTILKLPQPAEAKPDGKRTRMRRVVAEDGMPVFVSEEVRMGEDPNLDTRESAIRRPASAADDSEGETSRQRAVGEESTVQPETGEVTATREAASMPADPSETSTPPPGAARMETMPRVNQARGAGTVVRAPAPPPAASRNAAPRPSEIATPPRGTPRPPAAAAPARAAADATWLPSRRTSGDAATVPAPRASAPTPTASSAPPEREFEIDDEPESKATFERAKVNPIVAESLRERPRDSFGVRIASAAIGVLIVGVIAYTFVEPWVRNRRNAVTNGAEKVGSILVNGRTGDHVKITDANGVSVYGSPLPMGRLQLAPGDYTVVVTGTFDGRTVSGTVSVGPGKPGVFDANLAAKAPDPDENP